LGLYYRFNKKYPPSKKMGLDIIDINIYIAVLFFVMWFLVCFYLNKSITGN